MPHGIILVTGPTGSGKTSTLYTALNEINDAVRKIITIEDPVEYQLKGVNQIQVSEKSGLTFARGLRSILRHDPDVVLIGEIRDQETAQIAVQASLTGHLVFSTLHTNDAPGALTRLVDMGVEPYLVASSLEAVLAQRLVRVLCTHCKQEDDSPTAAGVQGASSAFRATRTIYRSVGCRECRNTGFYGRHAIFEWMDTRQRNPPVDFEERFDAIRSATPRARDGMRTLAEDGWRLVRQGITTVEEVLSVTTAKEVAPATKAQAADDTANRRPSDRRGRQIKLISTCPRFNTKRCRPTARWPKASSKPAGRPGSVRQMEALRPAPDQPRRKGRRQSRKRRRPKRRAGAGVSSHFVQASSPTKFPPQELENFTRLLSSLLAAACR